MQPTGRSVLSSVRALIADGGQWNVGLRGRRLERPAADAHVVRPDTRRTRD